jgi:hypothetical protein
MSLATAYHRSILYAGYWTVVCLDAVLQATRIEFYVTAGMLTGRLTTLTFVTAAVFQGHINKHLDNSTLRHPMCLACTCAVLPTLPLWR